MAKKKKKSSGLKIIDMTYNQLVKAITEGKITEKEIRKQYTRYANLANIQIRKIEASDIPFTFDKPTFRSVKNLITSRELLHEVADLRRFMKSKGYTLKGREATRAKTLATLKKRYDLDLTPDEYLRFYQFMEWFKYTELAAKYDSDADIVTDIFITQQEGTAAQWEELFKLFEESGMYQGGIRKI